MVPSFSCLFPKILWSFWNFSFPSHEDFWTFGFLDLLGDWYIDDDYSKINRVVKSILEKKCKIEFLKVWMNFRWNFGGGYLLYEEAKKEGKKVKLKRLFISPRRRVIKYIFEERKIQKWKYFPSNGDQQVGARGRLLPRFSSFFATNRERKKRFTADVRETS